MPTLKYPTKIKDTLYPRGTVVEVVPVTDERLKARFPNIGENKNSTWVAILFDELDTPCIVTAKSIEYEQ